MHTSQIKDLIEGGGKENVATREQSKDFKGVEIVKILNGEPPKTPKTRREYDNNMNKRSFNVFEHDEKFKEITTATNISRR